MLVKVCNEWTDGKKINKEALKNEAIAELVKNAEKLVTKAVISTNQTFVDTLKSSGEFTEDKMEEAYIKTRDTVLKLMSVEMMDAITSTHGNRLTWLKTTIEATVNNVKKHPIIEEGVENESN